ncbi:uncharacterized protein J3R85_012314 [Psidium guajava]|nr:uncharacterized protein J3R85_012314 [Psidium guajava]
MALKQGLISAGNAKLFVFPTSNSSGSSPNTLFSFAPSIKHLTRNARLRCSLQAATYPRPQEIQWRKELTNSVQLIGIVSTPVEVRNLPSGKVVAWTRLAVRKSPTDTSWINLTFWDELALTASQHLEKGHQIFVSGRLVSDVVESDEGKQQIFYKVVVQQLNFIERNLSPVVPNDHASGRNFGSDTVHNNDSTVELWQAFFANPLEWWDNRKNKKNPKYPDFKHKDTGEALWVEGRYNPPWVKSQLAKLDSRMGSLQWQDARMPVSAMAGDDALSF